MDIDELLHRRRRNPKKKKKKKRKKNPPTFAKPWHSQVTLLHAMSQNSPTPPPKTPCFNPFIPARTQQPAQEEEAAPPLSLASSFTPRILFPRTSASRSQSLKINLHHSKLKQQIRSRSQLNRTQSSSQSKESPAQLPPRTETPTAPEDFFTSLNKVKDYLIQVTLPLATTNTHKNTTLDFIQLFREYFENGSFRGIYQQMEKQVTTLDNIIKVTRKLSKETLQKKELPAVQIPANAVLPATLTLAQVAQAANPGGESQPIQTASKPKKLAKTRQEKVKDRQLILIRSQEDKDLQPSIENVLIREHINKAFKENGLNKEIVSTANITYTSQHIMITTMPGYSATFLQEHLNIWATGFPYSFQRTQVNTPWYKAAIHGVLLHLTHHPDPLENIAYELKTFNNMDIIGKPYWLTSQEKRENGERRAGSIVVAFKTKSDLNKAIKTRLNVYGVSCKAELVNSAPPTYQCRNCQGYGHPEARCRSSTVCRICSEDHLTKDHSCKHCPVKGKVCNHSILKCANCQDSHIAGSQGCPAYIQVHRKYHEATEEQSSREAPMDLDNNIQTTPIHV